MTENVIVLSWGEGHCREEMRGRGTRHVSAVCLPAEALDLPPEPLNILYLLLKGLK